MKIQHAMFALTVSLLGSLASAQEYSLDYRPTKGEKLEFLLTFDIDGYGQPLVYRAKVVNETVEVFENGEYLIAASQSDSVVLLDGVEQQTAAEESTAVTRYDKSGRPLSIAGDNATPESMRVANLTSFIGPGRAIKVGDEWSIDIKGDKEAGTADVVQKYRLMQVVEGVCVVEMQAAETTGANKASAKGLVKIDFKTMQALSYEAAVVDLPVGIQMVSGKLTIVLKKS